MKDIVKLNSGALSQLSKSVELAGKLVAEAEFHDAEWFDTPEKRITWWFELEPQWKRAFNQAVFYRKMNAESYVPNDEELTFLFNLKFLGVVGDGEFYNRNNPATIDFQLSNYSGVKNLTNLEIIHSDYNRYIDSLEPLSKLHQLRELWCDNNSITDLSPIAHLPNLTSLCCWNNDITDISPLAISGILEDLVLGLYDEGNPISSLEPLRNAKNLRKLHLSGCPITSLEPLESCRSLSLLDIEYTPVPRGEVERFKKAIDRYVWIRS